MWKLDEPFLISWWHTGKTYKMEREMRNKGEDLPAKAEVVPTTFRLLFYTIQAHNI